MCPNRCRTSSFPPWFSTALPNPLTMSSPASSPSSSGPGRSRTLRKSAHAWEVLSVEWGLGSAQEWKRLPRNRLQSLGTCMESQHAGSVAFSLCDSGHVPSPHWPQDFLQNKSNNCVYLLGSGSTLHVKCFQGCLAHRKGSGGS